MPDLSYFFEAIFAVLRISVWFWLLFVVIAPLFLKYIRNLSPIEKMIYSWIGLGGTIIVSIFLLTILHIYDFISIILVLLLIPLGVDVWKHRHDGIIHYLKTFEIKTVVSHVRFIENYEGFSVKRGLNKARDWFTNLKWTDPYSITALIIALIGGFTRMIPALEHASPFSRNWYVQLDRIKNIRLQQYFTGIPEPGGMHSLVSLFSMITQVSPEMILHLLGAMTSFFLCIIIYWATKNLVRNEYPLAPLFAMSVYALVPMLLLPLSLDQQIEGNTLDLALCFAVPTVVLLLRSLRGTDESPLFYTIMGFTATAFTNIFVAFVILLPALILILITIPRKKYWSSLAKKLGILVGLSVLVLLPFVVFLVVHKIDIASYFRGELLNTQAFSYFPLLIMDLGDLSQIYVTGAVILIIGLLIKVLLNENRRGISELFFLIIFIGLSLFYLPQINLNPEWLDPDQLNGFYALMSCIVFGLCFANIMRFFSWIIRYRVAVTRILGYIFFVGAMAILIFLQGGLQYSRVLPSTLPDGFFKAYYQIIDHHLPYSYATVGPEINLTLAKNRHYFMNYSYFLEQYGSIDSLYHQQLSVPEQERNIQTVPPSSIFVFVEKPPYGSIQQGILYNSGDVMRNVEQWISAYKNQKNRTVKTFYNSDKVTVYEIVNRSGESNINDILLHVNSRQGGIQ